VGVGEVFVFADQVIVDAYVELAVDAGDKAEDFDVVATAGEGFAGHPGGAEGVASMVAVFDFDFEFLVLGHGVPPGMLGEWY